MRERLIELIANADNAYNVPMNKSEFVADFLLANGVVALPCEIDDTVFVIPTKENGRKEITLMACLGFVISTSGNVTNCFDKKNKLYQSSFDAFGKTVFLTHKEAEAALEASNATP